MASDALPNVAQDFYDALVRHAIYLQRYSSSLRDMIIELMDGTETQVRQTLLALLPDIDLATKGGRKRLDDLIAALDAIRSSAVDEATSTWSDKLNELAKAEPDFMTKIVKTVSPVVMEVNEIDPDVIESMVQSRPFEGRVLKEWAKDMGESELKRMKDAIVIGLTRGETTDDIVRRIIGSAKLDGVDGITEMTRRAIQQITRTAVNFISNEVRQEFYAANEDIIDEELFVATLDSRTTPICRAKDGERFPRGEGPIPPLHFGCRSTRVAVITDKIIGQRPFKSSTEKLLAKRYADQKGYEGVSSRDDLPRGAKTDFDKWARAEVRKMSGQVDAGTSYQKWLSTQSAAFQNEVLGDTRAKLFRDGKLKLDRFVDDNGNTLTLKELAKAHASAFRAAGLDPSEFE